MLVPLDPPAIRLTTERRSVQRLVALACLAVLTGLAPACSLGSTSKAEPGRLSVQSVTVDEPVNGRSAVVRLVIDNASDRDDRLIAVSTPTAARATLHESKVDAEGRSTMVDRTVIDIPAGRRTVFRAGGLHVMLEDLTQALKVGDQVSLKLTFAEAGTRTVTAEVVPIGESGGDMDMDMGSGDGAHDGH